MKQVREDRQGLISVEAGNEFRTTHATMGQVTEALSMLAEEIGHDSPAVKNAIRGHPCAAHYGLAGIVSLGFWDNALVPIPNANHS